MKKESLLTLTPRLIIAVTLIVMLGGLLGAVGYLTTKLKIDSPIEKSVTVTTDKTEYEQGETVKIIVRNNLDNSIWHRGDLHYVCKNAFYLGVKENNYTEFYSFATGYCLRTPEELKSHSNIAIELNSKEDFNVLIENENIQFPATYKLKFEYYNRNVDSNSDGLEIYSNEFTIKEKMKKDISNFDGSNLRES